MPDDVNQALKSKSRRGRKQKIGTARSDFTLEDADEAAKELRAKYAAEDAARRREARARGEILAKGAGVNTFRSGRLEELTMHPTVKPVALIADALKDCSKPGHLVLDPLPAAEA